MITDSTQILYIGLTWVLDISLVSDSGLFHILDKKLAPFSWQTPKKGVRTCCYMFAEIRVADGDRRSHRR